MKLQQHPHHRGSLRRSHGNRPLYIPGDQEGVYHGRRGRRGWSEKRQEPQAALDVRLSLLEEAGGQFGQEERQESDPESAARPVQPGGSSQQREHQEDAPDRREETQSAHPGPGAHGPQAKQRGCSPKREAFLGPEAIQQPVSGVTEADSHPGFNRGAAALFGGLHVPQVF